MGLFNIWLKEESNAADLIIVSLQYLNEVDKEALSRCCEMLVTGLVLNKGKLLGVLEEGGKECSRD